MKSNKSPHSQNDSPGHSFLHQSTLPRQQESQNKINSSKFQKNTHFLSKFKLNQHQLRNKFKSYILQEKIRYPFAYKQEKEGRFDEIATQQFQNIREIRREKNHFVEQLRKCVNERNYQLHQKEEHQKTFYLLSKKMKRVERLRTEHKSELAQLELDLKSIDESIREEKIRSKMIVSASKANISRNRLESGQRKLSLANETRNMKTLYRERISQQRLSVYEKKQQKCQTVRKLSKNIELNTNKLLKKKQIQAQELRFERIFREFAEKQEIKIASNLQKKDAGEKIVELKSHIVFLSNKIKNYRTRLGESSFDSTEKLFQATPKHKNRSFTESRGEMSTNGDFITGIKYKAHTEESFND